MTGTIIPPRPAAPPATKPPTTSPVKTPSPTSPAGPSVPKTPTPTPNPVQQAQTLAAAISTAASNPDKPPPPTPDYSAEVEFLVDLADNAFYGPPEPPPAFAITNLVNAANNGSVPAPVIAQVLYDLSVMFGPSDVGSYSLSSFYQVIASEAAAGVVSSLAGGLTQWGVTEVTSSSALGEEAGEFIGSLSGAIVDSAIEGNYGGSALEAAVGTILGFG